MSAGPMLPPAAPSVTESDLDSTAELPVLEAAAYERDPQHSRTDTWLAPHSERAPEAAKSAPADDGRPLEASLQAIAANLRETQELLAAKGERLAQVERARDEANADRAAAEQRAAQVAAALAQLQLGATQHATQLGELTQARAAAEQRAALLQEELGQARVLVAAANEHAAQLQRALEENASAGRQRGREREAQQALAEKDRARIAAVSEELRREQARATTYFESLQNAEGRRRILEEMQADLQREAEGHDSDLARLVRELAGRRAHVQEQDEELGRRAAGIARLEQQISSFAAALAQRDEQLREAGQEAERAQAELLRLQSELAASAERARALQTLGEQQRSTHAQQHSELHRLLAERSELNAALESARVAATAAATQTAQREAERAQERGRIAGLDAALTTERQRAARLEEELTTLRAEMEQWGNVLKNVQQEREAQAASLTAAEARASSLEARAAQQLEAVRLLQSDSTASVARARELEGDLRAAEDAVHRLESEVRGRHARVQQLESANQQWGADIKETRYPSSDKGVTPGRQGAREGAAAEPPVGAELAHDGVVRLLINNEDGREIVHVLGRRTTVGRTPENDLQIKSDVISRHHAIILAGPVHTVIEDLNSTNGVLVNGRRITRQTLQDGDKVMIGRTCYRFALRRQSSNADSGRYRR